MLDKVLISVNKNGMRRVFKYIKNLYPCILTKMLLFGTVSHYNFEGLISLSNGDDLNLIYFPRIREANKLNGPNLFRWVLTIPILNGDNSNQF